MLRWTAATWPICNSHFTKVVCGTICSFPQTVGHIWCFTLKIQGGTQSIFLYVLEWHNWEFKGPVRAVTLMFLFPLQDFSWPTMWFTGISSKLLPVHRLYVTKTDVLCAICCTELFKVPDWTPVLTLSLSSWSILTVQMCFFCWSVKRFLMLFLFPTYKGGHLVCPLPHYNKLIKWGLI